MKINIFHFLVASGTGEPTSGRTKHVFKNKTEYSVAVIGYNDVEPAYSFELLSEDEHEVVMPAVDGANNGPFRSPIFQPHDSVLVYYADTLVIHFDIGRLDGNPMRISNYQLIEAETEPYIYLFEFTNEDYERALERGRAVSP
jgi:hypothetical protein